MKQQVYIELEYEVGCSKINKHSHALASIQFQQVISLKWMDAKISVCYSFVY